eukprot:10293557-Lingulodinium_polyedra.AAC.1
MLGRCSGNARAMLGRCWSAAGPATTRRQRARQSTPRNQCGSRLRFGPVPGAIEPATRWSLRSGKSNPRTFGCDCKLWRRG